VRVHWREALASARASAPSIVILTVLSVCGAADGDSSAVPAPEEQPSELEQSDSEPPDAMVTPRSGMLDVEPVRVWYEYGSWDGDRTYITFPSQGAPCEVLDRIEIDETESRITVTLYQGRDPDLDPDEPCDGPSQALGVVLPPFERDHGLEEGILVNGALTDDP